MVCEARGYVRSCVTAAGQWQHSLNLLKHTFPHWASSKLLLQCTRIFSFRTTDQLPNQDTELLLLVLNIHPSLGSFPPSSFNLNCFFCLCFTPVLFTFFFSFHLYVWQTGNSLGLALGEFLIFFSLLLLKARFFLLFITTP